MVGHLSGVETETWVWSSVPYKCEVLWPDGRVTVGGAPACGTFKFPPGALSLKLTNLDSAYTADFYVSHLYGVE